MAARIDSVYPHADSGDFWPEALDCCTINQVPVQIVWTLLAVVSGIALIWQAPSIFAIAAKQSIPKQQLRPLEMIMLVEIWCAVLSMTLAILKATDSTGDLGIGLNWSTSALFGSAIILSLVVNLVGTVEKVKLQLVLAFGDQSQAMGEDLYSGNACKIKTILGAHAAFIIFIGLCPVLMVALPGYLPVLRIAFWVSSVLSVCTLSLQQLIALAGIASKIDLHWHAQPGAIKVDHIRQSIISSRRWSTIGIVVSCINLVFIFSPMTHYTTYGLWASLLLFNLSTLQHSRRFLNKPQNSMILTKQRSTMTMLHLGT